MPRKEMPCVVGWATRLEERRKRLKPGIMRRRSSVFTPGTLRISEASRTAIDAGASVATFSTTVIELRTVSALSPAAGVCPQLGQTHQNSAMPAMRSDPFRMRTEDNLYTFFPPWFQ